MSTPPEQTDAEWLAEIFQHEKWCDACGLAEDGHAVDRDDSGFRHVRCLYDDYGTGY